jgi:hypothetical protein
VTFKKLTPNTRSKRILALLLGEADSGKSTLLAQLPAPMAGIDSDGRMDEIIDVARGDIFAQENLVEATEVDKALAWLDENMSGSRVQSIAWDSITPILLPVINRAMDLAAMTPQQREAEIGTTNKAAVWEPKARMMRKIQSIQNFGTHCVWVAHIEGGRDHQGKEHERRTIPETELDRFTKALNMKLRTIKVKGKYGVRIEWLRKRPGFQITLWDEKGNFEGMWERILEVANGQPAPDEPVTWKDFGISKPFPNPETAIQMGVEYCQEAFGQKIYAFGDPHTQPTKKDGEQGTNGSTTHARNAYDKLKRGEYPDFRKPGSAGEMAEAWKALVERKIASNIADLQAAAQEQQSEEQPQLA